MAVAANPAPATPGAVIDSPLSNTLYRLRFVFAGQDGGHERHR